jgi:putative membrane protein
MDLTSRRRNQADRHGLEIKKPTLEADMKNFVISVAAAVLVGAPVLAQSVGEKTGINSALDISPTTADFVKATTPS